MPILYVIYAILVLGLLFGGVIGFLFELIWIYIGYRLYGELSKQFMDAWIKATAFGFAIGIPLALIFPPLALVIIPARYLFLNRFKPGYF